MQAKKRQCTSTEHQSIKRQKFDGPRSAETAIKLDELNIDCLEIICLNLDVESLVAVANTHSRLKIAAQLAFRRKYRGITEFSAQNARCQSRKQKPIIAKDSIRSDDLCFTLRFIRCFGHCISELSLTVLSWTDAFTHIIHYANEYSNWSLKSICINAGGLDILSDVKKPFAEIEELEMLHCNTTSERLKWLFPKLKHLSCRSDDLKCIANHFPGLTSLNLHVTIFQEDQKKAARASVAECFRRNPQLLMLSINLNKAWNKNLIRKASEFLPALESLEISGYAELLKAAAADKPVLFKSVKRFKCHWWGPIAAIPWTFSNLEKFTLDGYNEHDDAHDIHNFLSKNPSISKLTIPIESLNNVPNISSILTSINSISLHGSKQISSPELISILDYMKTLQKLKFEWPVKRIKRLKMYCREKWQIKHDGRCFVKLKRKID